jgi:hypothetical protein
MRSYVGLSPNHAGKKGSIFRKEVGKMKLLHSFALLSLLGMCVFGIVAQGVQAENYSSQIPYYGGTKITAIPGALAGIAPSKRWPRTGQPFPQWRLITLNPVVVRIWTPEGYSDYAVIAPVLSDSPLIWPIPSPRWHPVQPSAAELYEMLYKNRGGKR